MAISLTLNVMQGDVVVSTHVVEGDIVKIGRLASAHLRLEDPKVSRIHVVLEVGADGAVSAIDMGSAQGTLVGGKRISKVSLASGDRMVVGDTVIELRIGEPAGKDEAAQASASPVAAAPVAAAPEAAAPVAAAPVAAAPVAAAPVAAAPVAAAPVAAAPVAAAPVAAAPVAAAPVAAAPVAAAPVAAAPVAAALVAAAPVAAAPVAAAPVAAAPVAAAPARRDVARPSPGSSSSWTLPIPWPKEGLGRDLSLDVRMLWGDQALDTSSFEGGQVTVGGKTASFSIDPGDLPVDPFPLARHDGSGWILSFEKGMGGGLVHEGEVRNFSSLVQEGKARAGDQGAFELSLPEDAAAWIEMGEVRAEFCFRPKRKPILVKWSETLDYGYLNILLIAFFLTAASIVGFHNIEYQTDLTADDLFANQARFTKLLLQPPEKMQNNPFLQKLKDLKAPEPGQTVRAPSEEGKAGKKDAPPGERRSAPQAIDPNDKEVIKNQGILSMLGKGSAGLSTIFGSGGLGGELKGAIGGITGSTVGDAQGFGGLGLRGTGPGGGAVGETVSVGAIGTRGRGGGSAGFGAGVGGLGKKGSADVRIDTSAVSITGTIDRELIRRVIQANQGKWKYCYESELVRSPNLSGRVAVQFQINEAGRVTFARIAQSTMNNSRVESCIAARIQQLTFPMPQGGGSALATYPFVFTPSGE